MGRAVRNCETRLCEEPVVSLRIPLPGGCPVIQMSQFGGDHGGLEAVQAEIAANHLVVIFGLGTMRAQPHQILRPPRVSSHHHASVAGGSQVLGREKGKATVMPNRAGAPPFVLSANRLGGSSRLL